MANCKICLNKDDKEACNICGIGYYWWLYRKPSKINGFRPAKSK